MAQVLAKLPALVPHMFLDGEWIWYCGPSLAGAENKGARETLKEIGFRFCFSGHVMRDEHGNETDLIGTWGHSCQRPLPPRRRDNRGPAPANDSTDQEAQRMPDLIAAL